MTRKDYNAIAAVIRENRIPCADPNSGASQLLDEQRAEYAEGLAIVFAADNPNFDRERFMRACGVE